MLLSILHAGSALLKCFKEVPIGGGLSHALLKASGTDAVKRCSPVQQARHRRLGPLQSPGALRWAPMGPSPPWWRSLGPPAQMAPPPRSAVRCLPLSCMSAKCYGLLGCAMHRFLPPRKPCMHFQNASLWLSKQAPFLCTFILYWWQIIRGAY